MRFYRALLRLYPTLFRAEYGTELLSVANGTPSYGTARRIFGASRISRGERTWI